MTAQKHIFFYIFLPYAVVNWVLIGEKNTGNMNMLPYAMQHFSRHFNEFLTSSQSFIGLADYQIWYSVFTWISAACFNHRRLIKSFQNVLLALIQVPLWSQTNSQTNIFFTGRYWYQLLIIKESDNWCWNRRTLTVKMKSMGSNFSITQKQNVWKTCVFCMFEQNFWAFIHQCWSSMKPTGTLFYQACAKKMP